MKALHKLCTVVALVNVGANVHAQFNSFALPSNAYLDRETDTLFTRNDVKEAKMPARYVLFNTPKPEVPTAPQWAFDAPITYQYTKTESKLSDATTSDAHSVTPELIMSHADLPFTADFKLQYQHSSGENVSQLSTSQDLYNFSVLPTYYAFLDGEEKHDKLTLGVGFTYGQSDFTTGAATGSTNGFGNAYALSPLVIMTHNFKSVPTLSFTFSPGFVYQWRESRKDAVNTDTQAGLLSLGSRFDYVVLPRLTLSPQATLFQDVTRSGFSGASSSLLTYGQFGMTARYAFPDQGLSFSAGYSYTAFNSQLLSHNVMVKMDVTF